MSLLVSTAGADAAVSVDESFGDSGSRTVTLSGEELDRSWSLTSAPGDLTYLIETSNGDHVLRVQRLDATGQVDGVYGGDGVAVIPQPAGVARSNYSVNGGQRLVPGLTGDLFTLHYKEIALDRGDVVVRIAVGHVLPSGRADQAFASSGYARFEMRTEDGPDVAMFELDRRGRPVVLLHSLTRVDLYRFTPAGKPDRTFGGDGRVTHRLGNTFGTIGAAIAGTSPVLLLSSQYRASGGSTRDGALAVRIREDGRLDTTFSGDGKALLRNNTLGGTPLSVVVDGRNRLTMLVGQGDPNEGSWRALDWQRLTPSGRRDSAFATATSPIRRGSFRFLSQGRMTMLDGRVTTEWSRGNRLSSLADYLVGLLPDGGRWGALGASGQLAIRPGALSADSPYILTGTDSGSDNVVITRRTVTG